MFRTVRFKSRVSLNVSTLDDRIVPAVLLVDDDGQQFHSAPFSTIQSAVDAANPGDTIRVADGLYTEQVTIPSDKDGLTIRAQHERLAVIHAPETMAGSKAIVQIDGADDVTIRGFTITGPSPDLDFGVQVTGGGSATIRDNVITTIRGPELNGSQVGIGVVIGGAEGATGSANVFDNVITDYQKGGIIVANDGSNATIHDNRIASAGPTDLIAQNGIQVSDGADAVISQNVILDNAFTGADVDGTGIIVSDAGNVVIAHNRIRDNQTGILAEGEATSLVILDNEVKGSLLDGIVLNESHGRLWDSTM